MKRLYQYFYILEGRFEKDSSGNDFYIEDEVLIHEMGDMISIHHCLLNYLDIDLNSCNDKSNIDFKKIINSEELIEKLQEILNDYIKSYGNGGKINSEAYAEYVLNIAGLIKALKAHSIYTVYYETNVE